MGDKIVLGLSGGVDSSLCAKLLLARGFDVTGVFLSYDGADPSPAKRTARELSIPLEITDITQSLKSLVIEPFIEAYLRAETPNPCVICNPRVKFKTLLDVADRLGAPYIATGHYAIADKGRLYASPGPKDQSYMLYRLPKEILERCVFPMGAFEDKARVRELAQAGGLSSGSAPDSMEICFIPQGDHGAFIEENIGREALKTGNFVDEDGHILAPHGGIHRYTVGQRRGLGVAAEGRLYVRDIDPEGGDITLSLSDPKRADVPLTDIAFTAPEYHGKDSFRCLVKLRHTKSFLPGECFPGRQLIRLDAPARAVSPGQSAVCYHPETRQVLCGGFIAKY